MTQLDHFLSDELFQMDGEVGIFSPKIHQALARLNPTMADEYADTCLLEEIYWRYAHCNYRTQQERDAYRQKYGTIAQLRVMYQYLGNKISR